MGVVIGLGEVLWDMLPEGRKLGGAPANFAYHVNGLGGHGVPVSRVGDDDLGAGALVMLRERGLDTSHIAVDAEHPTGTVLVELDADGKASYVFPPDVAWDFLHVSDRTAAMAARADGVCFGSLAQRSDVSRKAVRGLLSMLPASALKVFDVNLRGDYFDRELIADSLEMANVLKLSDEELPVLASMFGLFGDDCSLLKELVVRFGLKLCALTRGGAGSVLVTPGECDEHPGLPVHVVDTIGAGDSFTAAMTLGMLAGWPLNDVNERANRVAGAVCGQAGAMVELPEELRIFRHSDDPAEGRR